MSDEDRARRERFEDGRERPCLCAAEIRQGGVMLSGHDPGGVVDGLAVADHIKTFLYNHAETLVRQGALSDDVSMESWEDQALVLGVRPHGEGGGVVSVLTPAHGRFAGFTHGIHGKSRRGTLEPGNLVDARWQARTADQLGRFEFDLQENFSSRFMDDPLRLGALQSACALCEAALPEREGHEGLFSGLLTLIRTLDQEIWGAAYVVWEIALLRELGFGLDLSRCAGGGDPRQLAYVSPKTGRAVSYQMGEPYKDRLLPLPGFLRPNGGPADEIDVYHGLQMCGYFLEHQVFAQHSRGVPEPRLRFQLRFARVAAMDVY